MHSVKTIPLPGQAVLRALFDYNPETGVLTWRGKGSRKLLPGAVAGTLHHSGYVQVRIEGVIYLAHRLIWKRQTGQDPVGELDHRNGVRSDNRWTNLRPSTSSQNKVNRPALNAHRGVHFVASRGKFGAQIKIERKHSWLGLFDAPEAACAAYHEASVRLHGSFARKGTCACR